MTPEAAHAALARFASIEGEMHLLQDRLRALNAQVEPLLAEMEVATRQLTVLAAQMAQIVAGLKGQIQ
ncbi:MAG: hypothetical protein M5U08_16470 [Burkholderiales bacterium]|nr:hypothetical protein [Burkholderiales bacterium]